MHYSFDSGRTLTPEEIEEIRHTIRPVERIRRHYFGQTLFIDADIEPSVKIYKRLETLDK